MHFIDKKNLSSEIIFEKEIVSKVYILIDKSSIEIFINDGKYILTTKIFLENHNKATTDIEELEIY